MIQSASFGAKVFRKVRVSRMVLAVMLMLMSIFSGVSGFMLIENFTFIEAFYMTVITFSTVGYNEIRPLSEEGRIFVSFYIILNLAVIAYVVSVVSAYLFEGELNKLYKKYLFNKGVKRMNDHVIVCGFGRNGDKASEELHNQNEQFVIIENSDERIDRIEQFYKYKVIKGDATSDEVLMNAGIDRAKAIISTLPNDAENVFLSLTARQLNPDITIISRASEESSEKKLLRAGATKVIMPDAVGGLHMAQHITKPVVIEYLDMLSGGGDYILEEVHVGELKSDFRDQSILDMDIRKRTGTSVIGFKDQNNKLTFNPPSSKNLDPNDVLIIFGLEPEIQKFREEFLD